MRGSASQACSLRQRLDAGLVDAENWNRGLSPLFWNVAEATGRGVQRRRAGYERRRPNLPVEFPRGPRNVVRHNTFLRKPQHGRGGPPAAEARPTSRTRPPRSRHDRRVQRGPRRGRPPYRAGQAATAIVCGRPITPTLVSGGRTASRPWPSRSTAPRPAWLRSKTQLRGTDGVPTRNIVPLKTPGEK